MPSQFLWSPFSVLGPHPLEGRSVLLYTYICFLFELGSTALWKGIIFQSFVGPQDISVHEGKEYPPFAAFQVNSHSSHFSQLQFIIRGLHACCIPLTALSHKVIAKTHTTPKRPPPLYMAWITVERLKEKKTQRGMGGFLLLRGSRLGAECFSPSFGLAREPGGPYSVDSHMHRVILQGWLRFLICPIINLLPVVQILSFSPHRSQQSRENYLINCLGAVEAAWQGGAALLCQTGVIIFSLQAEHIIAVCCKAGMCMHACNRQLIIPMTAAAGRVGKGASTALSMWPREGVMPAAFHWGDFSAHELFSNEDFLQWMLIDTASCAPVIWTVGSTRSTMSGCLKAQFSSSAKQGSYHLIFSSLSKESHSESE